MIHAYEENRVHESMKFLAVFFDYAINTMTIEVENLIPFFLSKKISSEVEKGNPKYVSGKSGVEALWELLDDAEIQYKKKDYNSYNKTRDYWVGYMIVYYQWYRNVSFSYLFKNITYKEFLKICASMHTKAIDQFVEVVDNLLKTKESNLKKIRMQRKISQTELSKISGVSLRAIQTYEQKQKDINKAQIDNLLNLSDALDCTIEDLLER